MQGQNDLHHKKWDGQTDFFRQLIHFPGKRKISLVFSLFFFFLPCSRKNIKKVRPIRPYCPILILGCLITVNYITGQTYLF